MYTTDELPRLQKIADYRAVRKTVRSSGWVSIFFGAIAVAMGVFLFEQNPINGLLCLIGLMLLGTGIWNIANPTPPGIILDGITFLVLAAWNIFVTVLNAMAADPGSSGHTPVLAIFQIVWGCTSFSRYKRFARACDEIPSVNELRAVDELLSSIWKSKEKDATDLVQFTAQGFHNKVVWKGRLSGDTAVFVGNGGQDVAVAMKHETDVTCQGKVVMGKTQKVTVQVGSRTLRGLMGPESLRRFEEWKTGSIMPVVVR